MSTSCLRASSESLTLLFYGELPPDERASLEEHVRTCEECTAILAEFDQVRAALAARAEAARGHRDWAAFMHGLDAALEAAADAPPYLERHARPIDRHTWRGAWIPLAALLVLGIALGLIWQRRALGPAETVVAGAERPDAADAALEAAAMRHFGRAKLVVLGLAMKDAGTATAKDWQYERELAASLLPETRLFRLSAADHGASRLADLLGDLESVLLQASLTSEADTPELERIQRVIRRRDLLVRMDLES
ncbi:MAG TPA: zf-HC2 domain-containing protein [Vicinamibacterales bacterium]|nr:zf-HC2 domain-containing protein [Vicinamibacterales bacterium]